MLRAFIVDDEPPARARLRQLLAEGVLGELRAVVADMGEAFDADHRILRAELAGGPDEVGEALSRYAELGVNYVVARVVHPGMTHPEALDAIQLFGQAVVPGFRMYGLPPEISALP